MLDSFNFLLNLLLGMKEFNFFLTYKIIFKEISIPNKGLKDLTKAIVTLITEPDNNTIA